ncbi:MAG: hypothetical protein IJV04_09495, partial [Lachnospiraceae bacterium]|nr:hypothetical protein [Lachnospiraceae bacterium]
TGIEATCQEPLLVPAQVNKNKITVRRIFDGAEGDACAPEEFYIIRTSDFNSLAPDITEDAIRELEPCKLEIDDLKHSQTDTVSLTAIVFDERAASGFLSSKLSLPIRGGLEDEEAEEEVSSMLDELVDLFDDTNTEVVRGEFSNETIANIKKAVSDLVDEYQSVQEDYDRILDALYDDEAPDTEDITEVIAHLKELASQSDDMIRMIEDSLDGASIPENASEKLKALLSKVAAVKAQSDAKAESLDTYSDALNEIYKLLELEEDSEEDEDGRIDVSRALDAITALNDTLKSTTSSLDIMAEEKAKLLASNAILENEKLSLASANASLTREKETWANEKSRLKASYETLASEKEDLQAENDILRAGSKDLEALAGENQRLSKANAALTQENTKLAKDKDTLTAANTSLSQAKELAEAALAKEKQNSEAALAKEKKASEAALDKEKKASEAALAEEKKAYEERTASLLSENNKLKAAMDGDTIALVEENQALIKAKKDLEEVNAGLAASNKTLTESGRKLESEKKSLESEYRKLQDTHDTLSSANKELTASNKKLKTANKDLESTRESLTAKMNALTKEKASLTKDRDSLKAENKKLSSSDSELAKLKKENKSIKS